MALVFTDRVKQTSTTSGTGTLDLTGTVTGFDTFVDGIGDANTCYYCIEDEATGDWEVGLGTVTDAGTDTLSRDIVSRSSNADALVSFASNEKSVFVTIPGAKVGLPTRYIEGLRAEYASVTTVTVTPGSCRNVADDGDITLASDVTIDITAGNVANGLDEATLTGTVTTVTSSASVTGAGTAFLTEFGTRAATGTVSTTGTAATGTGTKFLREYAVGDLLGDAANGYSRVTAVASNTALTLSAAIPGGDLSSATVNIIENPILEASNGEIRRVDTITSNTALTLTATITTGAAGTALAGSELADTWYAIWMVAGGSGAAGLFSTQRTSLLSPPTGYTTSARRIGWTRNNASSSFFPFFQVDDTRHREIRYEIQNATNGNRVLSSGSSTSWAPVDASGVVPPTSIVAYMHMTMSLPTGTAIGRFRARNIGDASTSRALAAGSEAAGRDDNTIRLFLDGAQFFDYNVTADNDLFLDTVSYFDSL